jgi:uncharacterized protein YggE
MATFDAAVVSEANTAAAALETNNSSMQRLFALLKDLGIADKDRQTSRFDISPRYMTERNQQPVINGYVATNQVQVRVRNLPQLGKVLDSLVAGGSNQLQGVRFGIDDSTGLMNQARNRAFSDARSRAELYASAAGGRVGKVLSVSEQEIPETPRPMRMRAMAAEAAVPIAAGEQELSTTIHVVYELLD